MYCTVYNVHKPQINNRKIGKVNCLCNRIEPFPSLIRALGIVLAHILQQVTQPAGLAFINSGTGTVLCGGGISQVQFDGRSIAPNPFPLQLYLLYDINCLLLFLIEDYCLYSTLLYSIHTLTQYSKLNDVDTLS